MNDDFEEITRNKVMKKVKNKFLYFLIKYSYKKK